MYINDKDLLQIESGHLALPGEKGDANEEVAREKLQNENSELVGKQEKYEDIISQLKGRVESEKKTLRELKSSIILDDPEKSELKEYFINCIEDVRGDIMRRRLAARSARAIENRLGGTLSMKRLVATPMLEIETKPKLNNFMPSDKIKVIEMLLSNETVLMKIYQALFVGNNGLKRSQLSSVASTKPYI